MPQCPVRWRKTFWGCREAITLPVSWFGGGCVPWRGDTSSFLRERGGNDAQVYQDNVLQGVVKSLNMTLFSGQEWILQQDSAPANKAKTTLEWVWRNLLAFISTEDWPLGSAHLNPLDKNCGLFWRTWIAKSITTAWRGWRDPSGDSACGDIRVARVPQGVCQGRGLPFWVTLL
jgi:hypothetical protein